MLTPRFTLAALTGALTYFTYSYMEPILVKRLTEFELNDIQRWWFFGILPMFYIPASLAVQYLPSWIEKRVTILTASLASFVAYLFVGPTTVSLSPTLISFV